MSLTNEQYEEGDWKFDSAHNEGHTKKCDVWMFGWTPDNKWCTCFVKQLNSYMVDDSEYTKPPGPTQEETEAYWKAENLKDQDDWMFGWEDQNPSRQSKGSKPSFVVRGRSILTILDKIRRRGK